MDVKILISSLVQKNKYKPLSPGESEYVREQFKAALPDFLKNKINGSDMKLYTKSGYLICNGFERIVIGDYGAYIEFSEEQATTDSFVVMKGQEWRLKPKYDHSKYDALTHKCYANDTINNCNLLIYKQKQTVSYADYKIGMYYIGVYDCMPSVILCGFAENEVARVQCIEHRKFYDSLWEIKDKAVNECGKSTIVKRLDTQDAISMLAEAENVLTLGNGDASSLNLPETYFYYD